MDGIPVEGPLPVTITLTSDGSVGGKGFSLEFQGVCKKHGMWQIKALSVVNPLHETSDPKITSVGIAR